ncbi:MAG TPA: helix-turn-helix transcriptional regulator [Conexibacter sp.]|jgi:transcriptional regulator with XRE-family HTH domain
MTRPLRSTPPPERRAFGRTVREQRGRAGISLVELSDFTRVDEGYLAAVERGDVEPTLRTMSRIAAGLEMPLSELVARWERQVSDRARG